MPTKTKSQDGPAAWATRADLPGAGFNPNGLIYRIFTGVINLLVNLACEIDDEDMRKVPDEGPLIFIANHVNFLDIPVMYLALRPRPVTAFARHDSWDNLLKRALLAIWGGIPIRRGEPDRAALRSGLKVLGAGSILAIAPEATRSGHGRLQQAHPGAVFLALQSGAPLQAAVHYGHEKFWSNIKRLKRTSIRIAVGEVFWLNPGDGRVTPQVRGEMVDEMMYQMAVLLPEKYRGTYSDLSKAAGKHLRFKPE